MNATRSQETGKPTRYSHALNGGAVVNRKSAHAYTHVVLVIWADGGESVMWSQSAELANKRAAFYASKTPHVFSAKVEPINNGVRP